MAAAPGTKTKLTPLPVAPFFDDRAAGERVDKVVANLVEQLKVFRAGSVFKDTAGNTLEILSWGTAGATEAAWVEVSVNGAASVYIRLYAAI